MTEPAGTSFANKAIGGFLSNGAAQAIKVGLQFLTVIILARFLMPEDFGLIAAVTPLLAFVILFQDIGLQQAVIQRKEMTEDQLNKIFWLMTLVGTVCMLIVMAASPLVADFYGDERLVEITIVTSFTLLFTSLGALPTSLLNRNLRFSAVAIINVAGSVAGFCAAMVAVLLGAGYWALVVSPLVLALGSTISAFAISKWKPSLPSVKVERDIFSFGANLTGFSVVNFFARNLDNILIGRYLGTAPLGFYDLAYKLLLFPIRSINEPLGKVIIPILSKMQDDGDRVRRVYLRTLGLLLLFLVPGMTAAVIAVDPVVRILLGEQWLPIAPIFTWLGIASLIQVMGNSTGWLFISLGKTNVMFKWGIYSAATAIISFIIGIQYSVVGVAIAYTINCYVFNFPVLYYLMGRVTPVKTVDFLLLQLPLLVSAALSWMIVNYLFIDMMGLDSFLLIFVALVVSYSLAIASYALNPLGRSSLKEGLSLAMKVKGKIIK